MLWQHIARVDTMASSPSAVELGLQVQVTGSGLLLLKRICGCKFLFILYYASRSVMQDSRVGVHAIITGMRSMQDSGMQDIPPGHSLR